MKKNPYLFILFWGLEIAGLLQILIFSVGVFEFLIFNKQILWGRNLIILTMGIALFLIGRKYSKKFG